MIQRGFTVVELIITITIMGILLLLAVVNVGATQARARDDERTSDVETIAVQLESYYRDGDDTSTLLNRYPTTDITTSAAKMKAALRDIDLKSLQAPGITNPTQTFIAATNGTQSTSGVEPQPTTNQYVYQPILGDGTGTTLCTGTAGTEDCRKFNIYYRTEVDNTVRMVTSRNQ